MTQNEANYANYTYTQAQHLTVHYLSTGKGGIDPGKLVIWLGRLLRNDFYKEKEQSDQLKPSVLSQCSFLYTKNQ